MVKAITNIDCGVWMIRIWLRVWCDIVYITVWTVVNPVNSIMNSLTNDTYAVLEFLTWNLLIRYVLSRSNRESFFSICFGGMWAYMESPCISLYT
jgi:hypothetical protein